MGTGEELSPGPRLTVVPPATFNAVTFTLNGCPLNVNPPEGQALAASTLNLSGMNGPTVPFTP
ncbi:hypothetical protein K2X89_14445, partial [Myxococcota bacterium]|nr:hypothetical protein [Myxococcota bacterium]